MDTKLAFNDDTPSYKETWLQTFQDLSVLKDIECVDAIEECLIEIIQQDVSADDSYFTHALETGSLPQQWVEKVLSLLQPAPIVPAVPVVYASSPSEESDAYTTQSVISRARTEKPLHKPKRLARTQRHLAVVESITKKHLSKTRKTSK
jgi:hypothetical protein